MYLEGILMVFRLWVASGPGIIDLGGSTHPLTTAKPSENGRGLRHPTYSSGLCGTGGPLRPPQKSMISGPEAP